VRHLYVYVDADLHDAEHKAATTVGVKMAPWLRQMVRHMSITDVPGSWQAARAEARSHDSHRYGARFMLRLDEGASVTLQGLVERFHVSRADIIR
jgi:hypothetical protein